MVVRARCGPVEGGLRVLTPAEVRAGISSGGPRLRAALDRLRDHGIEVFDRRGHAVLHDPWAARDAYIDVVLGVLSIDEFTARWVRDQSPDATIDALTLLEAQRHAMLMYTSCGWFFNDIAGLETVQVMRYAARAVGSPRRSRRGP